MEQHSETASAAGFPSPRLARKNVMYVMGIWLGVNILTIFAMASGCVTGMPPQIDRSAAYVLIIINLCLIVLILNLYLVFWIRDVIWYKRTGGLAPNRLQRPTANEALSSLVKMMPFVVWCVAAILLERWLSPKIWPMHREQARSPMLAVILMTPLSILFVLTLWRHRARFANWIWQEWIGASKLERLFRILLVCNVILITLIMFVNEVTHYLNFSVILLFLLVALGVGTLTQAGIAITTRRR